MGGTVALAFKGNKFVEEALPGLGGGRPSLVELFHFLMTHQLLFGIVNEIVELIKQTSLVNEGTNVFLIVTTMDAEIRGKVLFDH